MLAEERLPAPATQPSRRNLFAAAAILAVAPVAGPALAGPEPGGAASLYRQYLIAVDVFRKDDDPETEDANFERVNVLCYGTLDAPIHTRADAAAKVREGRLRPH